MSKIGFIHFSDFHIKKTDASFFNESVSKIISAIKNDWLEVQSLYLILSGDIAYSGEEDEYLIAANWVKNIRYEIKEQLHYDVNVFMVPGNHDCKLVPKNSVRELTVNQLKEKGYEILDEDILSNCVSAQKSYWNFYHQFSNSSGEIVKNCFTENTIDDSVKICEINSAITSTLNEGNLFIPVKNFPKYNNNNGIIKIAVFHHPLSWFTAQTSENNRTEFTNYIQNNFQFAFCGHEHKLRATEQKDLFTKNGFVSICGGAFYYDEGLQKKSDFQTLVYDINLKELKVKKYSLADNLYKLNKEYSHIIEQGEIGISGIYHSNQFKEDAEYIGFTLHNANGIQAKLSNIFVYPELEVNTFGGGNLNYIGSKKILDEDANILIIDGDAQSGKTSLAYKLCKDCEQLKIWSLYLKGNSINVRKNKIDDDVLKVIKNTFLDQYRDCGIDFESFRQKGQKYLFIDDFEISAIGKENFENVIQYLVTFFDKIFIFSLSSIDWRVKLQKSASIKLFYSKIHPFSNRQRSVLCEQFLSFYYGKKFDKEEDLLQLKNNCDVLRQIMRNKILPSYPIYILTILQARKSFPTQSFEKTSYAECYRTLIYLSLSKNANVENAQIEMYFKFLYELAYYLFTLKRLHFNNQDFHNFYTDYESKFCIHSKDAVIKNLIKANIIREDDGEYSFSYLYIYYYLVAGKIAEILDTSDGQMIVNNLCKNLNSVENANVLIFIAYHNKSDKLFDDVMLAAKIPFEQYSPATLDVTSDYFKFINSAVKEISSDVMKMDIDPYSEHEKRQISYDKSESSSIENESPDSSDLLAPILQAFRAIEIIGQIVKNKYASVEKNKIKEMVKSVFDCGFRTLDYFCKVLIQAKDELTEIVCENLKKKGIQKINTSEVERKTLRLLQDMSYVICHVMIDKVSVALNQKDTLDIIRNVAKENGSPIAKLTSYSISLMSGNFNFTDMETLRDEFDEKNILAFGLLKDITCRYVYTNNVSYQKKQRIATSLKMSSFRLIANG